MRWLPLVAFCALAACSRESSSPEQSSSVAVEAGPAPTTAPTTAPPGVTCSSARLALASFLATLPVACKTASDCDGYYLRASSCEPAIILAKPGVAPEHAAQLAGLQSDARRTCPPDPVACSPRPFRADCRVGRCVDALTPPMPTIR